MTAAALLLLLPAAVAGPAWSQIVQAGWRDHSTRQHAEAGTVQVLRRSVGGVPCFQGVATVDVPRESLLGVAADIPSTVRWSTAGVREAEVLGGGGASFDFYQYLALPGWTLSSDRFWFLHGTVERTAASSVFRWDRIEAGGAHGARYTAVRAAHPEAVEPPVNAGGWVFTDDPAGTRIQYYICSDVGGSIPITVQNVATTRTLPDTVGDLVREARRRAGR